MYKRLLVCTIVAVLFLIWVGSLVRSTGSGMGCPDWPKCFGEYIPPTSESQLADNYQEYFKEVRVAKNQRLNSLFRLLNLESLVNDSNKEHTTYSLIKYEPIKAWIEYLNRIVGVIVGLLVAAVFVFSLNKGLKYVLLTGLSLLVLLIEAFLGSVVVSTGLYPGLISAHLVLAILLLFLLVYVYFIYTNKVLEKRKGVGKVLWLSLLLILVTIVQCYFGIQIRENIDYIHHELNIYDNIIDQLGVGYYIHRSFSLIVMCLSVFFVVRLVRYNLNIRASYYFLPILIFEIFTGVTLGYLDVPRISQSFHLLLASLLLVIQFLIFLNIKFVKDSEVHGY